MLNTFRKDRRGTAAVEFALIAPVMIMFYYGLAEAGQALLSNRRAGHVATVVGDLVTQEAVTSTADVNDVFNIATSVFKPMPTGTLSMRVTSMNVDANSVATVVWSQQRGTQLAVLSGKQTDVPADLLMAGGLIRADVKYSWTSPIQQVMNTPLNFSHTMYMRPRGGVAVTKPN